MPPCGFTRLLRPECYNPGDSNSNHAARMRSSSTCLDIEQLLEYLLPALRCHIVLPLELSVAQFLDHRLNVAGLDAVQVFRQPARTTDASQQPLALPNECRQQRLVLA